MDQPAFNDDRPHGRFSLRSLFGVHGAAAAMCELASNAPLIASLIGVLAAFVLLQIGVLAACTWHVPRTG